METYITKVQNGEQVIVFRRSTPLFTINPIDSNESGWETVVDFTEIKEDGISGREILRTLLHNQHGKTRENSAEINKARTKRNY